MLSEILDKAVWENDFPFRSIQGYSANVKSLHGRHFALLGNAAEFLDPVFSSGVTIALHSAELAADLLTNNSRRSRRLANRICRTLMIGVDAFRTYVDGWYDFRFQNVVYAPDRSPEISRMLSSIWQATRGIPKPVRGEIRTTPDCLVRMGRSVGKRIILPYKCRLNPIGFRRHFYFIIHTI
ncbi:FAD-binding protein [Neisseria gonorrhoeae]|uniref:FAD-binding protein n=1 Tax=Neisseria gonorrhoeae TaxID=485 RepID=A0A378VZN0_NEIGO|nr:FAD-binding protein [Neisseria gonorrhoeae]